MPVFSRKTLRRALGQSFLHDVAYVLPNQNLTIPLGAVVTMMHGQAADTNASGQSLFQGSWLYVEGSNGGVVDSSLTMNLYTVGSFNNGSGAFIAGQVSLQALTAAVAFEVHTRLSPLDKDRAIDDTIQRLRVRREVALPTIDGALYYTIDGCASPFVLDQILDIHLATNPTGSLDYGLQHLGDWDVLATATGNQLRLPYAVGGSQALFLDAILIPSLGSEVATINLPDERWILAGAAMKCYDTLIQSAPPQQAVTLERRRADWAIEYSRLSTRFAPTYDAPQREHDVTRGFNAPQGWD